MYLPDCQISHQMGGSVVTTKSLPIGLRTLAYFIPIKDSGKIFHQVNGRNLYHGYLISFLIALVQYLFGRGK